MQIINKKSLAIFIIVFAFSFIGKIHAQNEIPEWIQKLPVKKGFIYGAGTGNSANLSMAYEKSSMDAKNALANNYSNKLETFAIKCDTVLGKDNQVRQIITTVTTSQSATLTGIEVVEKVVVSENGSNKVYLLLRMDVSADVKKLEKQIHSDAKLRKKLDKAGLLKELSRL